VRLDVPPQRKCLVFIVLSLAIGDSRVTFPSTFAVPRTCPLRSSPMRFHSNHRPGSRASDPNRDSQPQKNISSAASRPDPLSTTPLTDFDDSDGDCIPMRGPTDSHGREVSKQP
jgi:hypothetical protein